MEILSRIFYSYVFPIMAISVLFFTRAHHGGLVDMIDSTDPSLTIAYGLYVYNIEDKHNCLSSLPEFLPKSDCLQTYTCLNAIPKLQISGQNLLNSIVEKVEKVRAELVTERGQYLQDYEIGMRLLNSTPQFRFENVVLMSPFRDYFYPTYMLCYILTAFACAMYWYMFRFTRWMLAKAWQDVERNACTPEELSSEEREYKLPLLRWVANKYNFILTSLEKPKVLLNSFIFPSAAVTSVVFALIHIYEFDYLIGSINPLAQVVFVECTHGILMTRACLLYGTSRKYDCDETTVCQFVRPETNWNHMEDYDVRDLGIIRSQQAENSQVSQKFSKNNTIEARQQFGYDEIFKKTEFHEYFVYAFMTCYIFTTFVWLFVHATVRDGTFPWTAEFQEINAKTPIDGYQSRSSDINKNSKSSLSTSSKLAHFCNSIGLRQRIYWVNQCLASSMLTQSLTSTATCSEEVGLISVTEEKEVIERNTNHVTVENRKVVSEQKDNHKLLADVIRSTIEESLKSIKQQMSIDSQSHSTQMDLINRHNAELVQTVKLLLEQQQKATDIAIKRMLDSTTVIASRIEKIEKISTMQSDELRSIKIVVSKLQKNLTQEKSKRAAAEEKLTAHQECPLCMSNNWNIALNPCGHLMCSKCMTQHCPEVCPICRQNILEHMLVYPL